VLCLWSSAASNKTAAAPNRSVASQARPDHCFELAAAACWCM